MKFGYLALFVLLVHLGLLAIEPVTATAERGGVVTRNPADYLSFDYYLKTCPAAEGIIQQKVGAWIKKDFTLAPSLIRLHFHDCAVRVSRETYYIYIYIYIYIYEKC
jgi:peroxidase